MTMNEKLLNTILADDNKEVLARLENNINKSNEILDRIKKNIEYDEEMQIEMDGYGDYDPDSSPIAWEYYKKMYGWLNSIDIYKRDVDSNDRIFLWINYRKTNQDNHESNKCDGEKIKIAV